MRRVSTPYRKKVIRPNYHKEDHMRNFHQLTNGKPGGYQNHGKERLELISLYTRNRNRK